MNSDQERYADSLRKQIEAACNHPPPGVVNGSYVHTLDWKDARVRSLKVAQKVKSTVSDLTAALSNMERFK